MGIKTSSVVSTVAAATVGTLVATGYASADDIDYSTMISGVSAAGTVAAIVGMGVIKLAPNFAKWGVNKVAGFFGR